MNNRTDAELDQIVTSFTGWVKDLKSQVSMLRDESALRAFEQQVRGGGQALLGRLMQTLIQQALDTHEPATRTCRRCRISRRHKGRRSRKLLTSMGPLKVQSVYWQCPACGLGEHAVDRWSRETLSPLLRELMSFTAASTTSFAKAQQATEKLMGVNIGEQTLRRLAQREGHRLMRKTPELPDALSSTGPVVGSCDGTMVHTRQSGWREIKACRFEHERAIAAAATLEPILRFEPLLTATAKRVGWDRSSQKVFVSDAAIWIEKLVERRLPGTRHIIDLWHARQHIHDTAKQLYGEGTPDARRWGRRWSERLRRRGAAVLTRRLRRISMHYRKPDDQRHVLQLARFLEKHAHRMAYPDYERDQLPISSGSMESYCKQLGLRLKGRGMRWNTSSVSPMATLVTYWNSPIESAHAA